MATSPGLPCAWCRAAIHRWRRWWRLRIRPGGLVLDVFSVEHEIGEPVNGDRLAADLGLALAGRLPVEARVAERARAYAGRGHHRSARPPDWRVMFEQGDGSTTVEVRAPDGIGLLYRLSDALGACGLDVRSAKVATLGHEAVDTFSVTANGQALPADEWPALEATLLGRIAT